MSHEVYSPGGGAPVSTQWVRVLNADEANLGELKGYFGAAWYNRDTKELVFAHRGTEADSWQDWMTDAQPEITYCDLTYSPGISIVESAEGGADSLYGGAGEDWIFAGGDDDYVDGGGDADVVFGEEAGEDELGQYMSVASS